MDGARLAQAAASLNCSLAVLTVDVGIDIRLFTIEGVDGA
ncbi:hypothetical protein DCC26_10480 [Auritidibacter sp. NML120779]|nr:hypothetical protein DCC26_10480 [Auritidibacter sp. NML120779]